MSYPLQVYKTLIKESVVIPAAIFFSRVLGDFIPSPGTIVTDPPIFDIRINQRDINSSQFDIKFANLSWLINSITGEVIDFNRGKEPSWSISNFIIKNPDTFSINYTRKYLSGFHPNQEVTDIYKIDVFPAPSDPFNRLAARASLDRSFSAIVVGDVMKPAPTTIQNDNLIEIPSIDILGQTLVDFSDVGNMTFTIGDEFTYYQETPLKHSKCIKPKMINKDQLKLTILKVNCPLLVNVIRGKGETMYEKAASIYKKGDLPGVYLNMIIYGMLRLILARILYGSFNVKYILNKYNHKFFSDLKNSRFCSFIEAFTNPDSEIYGYEKYFK
jgi:hypothetical protein